MIWNRTKICNCKVRRREQTCAKISYYAILIYLIVTPQNTRHWPLQHQQAGVFWCEITYSRDSRQTEVSLLVYSSPVPLPEWIILAPDRLRIEWNRIHTELCTSWTTNLFANYITAPFCKHSKRRCAKASDWLSRLHCTVIKPEKSFLWHWKQPWSWLSRDFLRGVPSSLYPNLHFPSTCSFLCQKLRACGKCQCLQTPCQSQ